MPVNILEANIPTILIEGQQVPVLHPHLPSEFGHLAPEVQRRAIRGLESLLEELRGDGSMAHLHRLRLIDDDEATSPFSDQEKAAYKHTAIDSCCWQLAQFLRYSTPTRIAEAVPHLTYVVQQKIQHAPDHAAVDVIPLYYLGVALARNGDDQRAIERLRDAMDKQRLPDAEFHPLNMMWAQAHLAWLYRKAGRITDAESQENSVCRWILTHPYAFPRSTLLSGLTDEEVPELGAHIVDNPQVARFLENTLELGGGMSIHFG
ncbi:hypothetical protein CVT24_001905 [Panaeolus cyanescens]|uniref:Tetratricopeptide repeat protein n=1 Tax=Panaeolus cyanescens TaxID=181874 RepID=A0A409YEL4_9AGAR|nr:hypothetical protein CVT24_001905 [Panaeolus cyanescens]